MRTAIARFLQYLTVERNASAYTIKSYREDLTALADYLTEARGGNCPLPEAITVLELRGYVAAMHEAGYAKTSIARRLASLRSFFKFGQREGWTKTNPAKPLRNPRKGRSLPHFLSAEDIGRLLAAPPANTTMGLRDRAILETMYSAGLRVSEDGRPEPRRHRFRRRHLAGPRQGPQGAAGPHRLLCRRGPAQVAGEGPLESPRAGRRGMAPVFLNKFGRRLTTRSVARMLEKYLQLTGLDTRTTPHSLRHSFATHLLGPRGRHPQRAGASGPQESRDHADLHARQHGRPPRGLRKGASRGRSKIAHGRILPTGISAATCPSTTRGMLSPTA